MLPLAHVLHRRWSTQLDNLADVVLFGGPTSFWVGESREEVSALRQFVDLHNS